MRVIALLLLICFFTGCGPLQVESPPGPTKCSLADEVRKKAFTQLKMEKELYPCGFGSSMMNEIKMLALAFNYHKGLDIEQARELLMDSGSLFLNIINSNDQIRPYLKNYPFKPENINIRIFLQNPDGSKPPFGDLILVSMVDGTLEYKIRAEEPAYLRTIYEEKFEEAALKLGMLAGLQKPEAAPLGEARADSKLGNISPTFSGMISNTSNAE